MIKIILGLCLTFVGVCAVIKWWNEIFIVVRGTAGIILILFGAIVLAWDCKQNN
jgi:hypothetical protein